MLRYYAGIILLSIVACSSDRAPTGPAGKVAVLPEPTNLGLENLTDTSVRFVWDEVEGAADYDINIKRLEEDGLTYPIGARRYTTILRNWSRPRSIGGLCEQRTETVHLLGHLATPLQRIQMVFQLPL